MATPLQFVGGDELVEDFLLEDTDGEILDLTGLSVSGAVRWRGRARVPLSVGAELDILTLAPVRAPDPANQDPHGFFRLTEGQTDDIPFGAIAFIRIVVVDAGATLSTFEYPLERIP